MKKIFATLLITTNIGAMLEPCSHLREASPRSRRLLMLIAPIATEQSCSKERIFSQLFLCPTSPAAKRIAQELKNSAIRE